MRRLQSHPAFRFASVTVFLAALALVWGVFLRPQTGETDLRDLSGIEIEITGSTPSANGLTVDCRIENRGPRTARSVVFTVSLVAENGEILASNPLGNTLNLKPGAFHTVSVPLPVPDKLPPTSQNRAELQLVRWAE